MEFSIVEYMRCPDVLQKGWQANVVATINGVISPPGGAGAKIINICFQLYCLLIFPWLLFSSL